MLPITTPKNGTILSVALVFLIVLSGCASDLGGQRGEEEIRFENVARETGFQYNATDPLSFGNGRVGVYVLDFDRNRQPDLLTIGGAEPALFENHNGQFQRSGELPEIEPRIKGALIVDYNQDGWNDILLLPINDTPVLLENENGSFRQTSVGFDSQLSIGSGATTGDFNQDGCPDVFIFQNGDWRQHAPKRVLNWGPENQDPGPVQEDNGNPNYLYAGDCDQFERVETAGISGNHWSTAASFVDLTGDGLPDIHVANDFHNDTLYVNEGDGTFERQALPSTNRHGMASEVADVNGDHAPDVFVTNVRFDQRIWAHVAIPTMGNQGNNLLINRGDGSFQTQEHRYGVANGGWGWAASLVDLDNDGDRDLVHTTRDYRNYSGDDAIDPTGPLVRTRPRIWVREDDRFQRRSSVSAGFGLSNGKGLASLDFDLDGDQDLVIADSSGAYKLYENQGSSGNWLDIRPVTNKNTTAIGAEVYVTASGRTQYAPLNAKADFRSQDSRTLHFGLDDASTVKVRIVWPDGTVRSFHEDTNQRLIVRKDGGIRSVETSSENEGFFEFDGIWDLF